GLVVAERPFGGAELPPRDHPGGALEEEGQPQHDVADHGIGNGLGTEDVKNSLVRRHARAEREDQQRDDEAPEVELSAVAERVLGIGTPAGPMKPIKQEDLVAAVDE